MIAINTNDSRNNYDDTVSKNHLIKITWSQQEEAIALNNCFDEYVKYKLDMALN